MKSKTACKFFKLLDKPTCARSVKVLNEITEIVNELEDENSPLVARIKDLNNENDSCIERVKQL